MLLPTRLLCVARAACPSGNLPMVHIPLDELEARQHELAPPFVEMELLPTGVEAYYALGWLHARGRRARLSRCIPRAIDRGNPPQVVRYRLWEPNEFLQQVAPLLPPGRGLDLACGAGREAVYLADLGWQVVAVDRLPDALERGRELQARYAPDAPPIQWLEADLETDWCPAGSFDIITCFFFLHRPLVQRVSEWLRPGGHFLMETFTTIHRAQFGRPSSEARVLRPGELPTLLPSTMTIRHYDEGWHTRGHTARLWAQRRNSEPPVEWIEGTR
ncbi:Ubiquinone/menaquinone biosynthesis C-methyltransferase UbiE [bacterium HR15]|nr:Ubiquinone/menaquinone biosynthesis C-methyltransferase UbiE [bacterium HR15]